MIGRHISIYRQRNGGSSPGEFETPEGVRLAVWQTSWRGLEWLDELVKQDKAIDLGGNGYPIRYTAQARHLKGRVLAGPPQANEVWVLGPQDVVTDKWVGRTVIDDTPESTRELRDSCDGHVGLLGGLSPRPRPALSAYPTMTAPTCLACAPVL